MSNGVTVSKYGRFLSKEVVQVLNYISLWVEKLHYKSGSQVKPLLSSCQLLGYIVLSKTAKLNQLLNSYVGTDCMKSVKIMQYILFYQINRKVTITVRLYLFVWDMTSMYFCFLDAQTSWGLILTHEHLVCICFVLKQLHKYRAFLKDVLKNCFF